MGKNGTIALKPSVSMTVKTIVDMPVSKAERAIEAIADKNGDEFTKNILAHIPAVKIAAIFRQHDFSCPSIISWLVTPKMVVKILKVDPLFWKCVYNGYDLWNFRKIQNDALSLISSILLNAKDRDQQESILQHVWSDELSLLYLFLPFIGWTIQEEQTSIFEDSEIDMGTVDHLFELIRWASPFVAKQILEFVYSTKTLLPYHITDLWLEAFNYFENGRDFSSIENAMFAPIN